MDGDVVRAQLAAMCCVENGPYDGRQFSSDQSAHILRQYVAGIHDVHAADARQADWYVLEDSALSDL